MVKMTDGEFNYLVNYIKKNYGIDLSRKRILMEGRLGNYLRDNGYEDYSSYFKTVENDATGKEVTVLLNKLTTNHTYFMREAEHFDFFKNTVLPQMEGKVRDHDLRIWCAASSTGEEPYTLAMILNDYFGAKTPKWDKTLLASDLSMRALEQAQNGIYLKESIGDIPSAWSKKYFRSLDQDRVQLTPEIRKEVVFRQINLMDKIVAKKPYHVVFCRNVMIYFDGPTKSDLVDRIYDVMQPGGYLFIGLTESVSKPNRFRSVMPSVYQKGV